MLVGHFRENLNQHQLTVMSSGTLVSALNIISITTHNTK